jgi:fluoroacetyl-CoA thioesterase
MKSTLVPGLKAEVRHRVVTQELLSSIYPDGPAVFATPYLLSLMEQAAAEAILPHLDPGEASVGYGFEFQHLAPTPVGNTVVATGEVIAVDKNLVTLHIEARDDTEVVSRGKHIRAIIDMDRFMRRVKRKSAG